MNKIFEGIKVLDCGSFIAIPAATTILSDFGADVIKIEPPGAGDPYRQVPRLPGSPESDFNYGWMVDNRNKKGLALDIATPEGREILLRLVSQSDVFATNFPDRVRNRLGITYEQLGELNKRLIYASFSGYGERGSEANKPGFDVTAWWARSGMMDMVRADAAAEPARPTLGLGDHSSAMTLFAGIVTALYQRELTGRGGQVSSSLLANGLWSNAYYTQAALCGARFIDRPPREQALNALTSYYRCADGRWLILTIVNEERHWPSLAAALGRPELVKDARFTTRSQRYTHSVELIEILDEVFATHDREHWRGRLNANGIIFDIVATAEDLPRDQQLLDNDMLVPFAGESMLTIDSPFTVAGTDKVQPRQAPGVGQHSEEVLLSAGYDTSRIKELQARGIVA